MRFITFLLLIVLIFGVLPFGCVSYYNTAEWVEVTVTDKERITTENSSYYLIFTEQGTFTLTDSLMFKNFNASDDYGHLRRGEDYRVRVVGWRMPFLSSYQNIVDIKDI